MTDLVVVEEEVVVVEVVDVVVVVVDLRVEVVEDDWLMNDHVRFGTYHLS